MSTHHHPSESWLIRYATGRLADSFHRVVESHIAVCPTCRSAVADATEMTASLCEGLDPMPLRFDVKSVLADLDDDDKDMSVDADASRTPADLVALINQMVDVGGIESLRWRPAGRGVSYVRLKSDPVEGRLWLLRAAPGTVLPQHTHRGDELTLVLKGAYCNRNQMFSAGDIEEADETVEHRPLVTSDEECICLAATDAPLKFRGLLPRVTQPFTRL